MNNLFVGNIIAFLASLIMVYTGILKDKKKIIYFQGVQIGLFVISNFVLGGVSGIIINVMNLIRNILCYKDRFFVKEKIFIIFITVILTLKFNNLGLIGLLPLIGSVIYTMFMNIKDVKKFKFLMIFTMVMWLIYDLSIKSYSSFLFDGLTILTNLISLFTVKNKE